MIEQNQEETTKLARERIGFTSSGISVCWVVSDRITHGRTPRARARPEIAWITSGSILRSSSITTRSSGRKEKVRVKFSMALEIQPGLHRRQGALLRQADIALQVRGHGSLHPIA